MYYSYTGGRNYYGELTNDKSTGNLTNGDSHINSEISRTLNLRAWPFLFREGTAATTASQQHVIVPANYKKLTSVKVTQSSTVWTPKEVPNRAFWDGLNRQTATSHTSDIPEWWYFFNGRCHFWPTPATTGNIVTFFGRVGFDRLNVADYTTGSILTATITSTSIVGTASTAWHTGMAGRYIRITDGNAANSGDDEWYEIASVTSATALTIVKPYLGASISGGAVAYTIGQMSPIPDGYQEGPIFYAAHIYYASKTTTGAATKSAEFKEMWGERVKQLTSDYGMGTDNVIVEEDESIGETNPNLYVRL